MSSLVSLVSSDNARKLSIGILLCYDKPPYKQRCEFIMINLLFKTRAAGLLSESLSVNSSVTAAEVYNQDLQVGEIQWEVLDAVDNAFELLQNKPNPFTDQTEISFVQPRDMSTTVDVNDLHEDVVKVNRNL